MSITDYPNGSTNANPLVLTDGSSQLQVTSGTATQSGVISETGGSFGLEKIGSGTLIYTADNTYTGVTTISGGTLQIGDDDGTGSLGAGAVINNATLTFNRRGDIIVANAVSGTGTLIQKDWGFGSLTLTGVNTYSGATIIYWDSTLALSGAGSVAASYSIDLQQFATFDISQTNSGATIKALDGDGIVALGSRTLTFANDANFTATFDGSIQDGGIGGGTGGSVVISSGSQQFAGTNTYTGSTTIAAGATLWVVGAGSLGSGAIINDGRLFYALSGAATARLMSGAGGLWQVGSGTLTVTGVEGYTGETQIYAGSTLALSGAGSIAASSGLTNVGTFDISGTTAGASIKSLGGSAGTGVIALGGKTLTVTLPSTSGYYVYSGVIRDGGIAGGTGGGLAIGGGTLVLLGANTYTGGTTLNGATLQLGFNWTSGSITGNVSGSGTVAFKRSDAFDGVISGNIAVRLGDPLTPALTGTTTLTGANTYTGGTTIITGTLQIGNGGTSGLLGTGSVTDNSVLVFNRSDDVSVANVISGSGALVQAGSGTTTLTAANTYSGGTTFSGGPTAGTIAVSSDANLGNANGALTFNNGTLKFLGVFSLSATRAITLQGGGAVNTIDTNGFATTISQVISGSGGLVKAGANTLTLSGANTFTGGVVVKAGDLALGTSSSAGTNSIVMGGTGFATLDYANRITIANNIVIQNNFAWLTVSDANGTAIQSGSISENNGPQSLVKFGYGTLVLTGNNTYTGGTIIRLGTLQVSADQNLGDPSGAITFLGGHSVLMFGAAFNPNPSRAIIVNNAPGLLAAINTNGFDIALAQGIGGSGDLTKTGNGVLTLNGVGTLAGALVVNQGVLRLGVDNVLSPSLVTINGGGYGTLDLNDHVFSIGRLLGLGDIKLGSGTLTANGPSTWDGSISGTGSLVIANTFSVSNANTYTGGTTVTGTGNLSIGVNNTGSILGGITNNGIVTFNRLDATVFSGAITGTGSVIQANSGTTTLTGANTYSGGTIISAGALRLGNGGASGSIAGNVTNNRALIFNRSDATIFAGAISGTGSVAHAGVGTTTLTGTNTYTGVTTVSGGTLLVDGAIASSAVSVASGATLGGAGTVGMTSIQGGGTLAPGDAPGAISNLHVNGNLIFQGGALREDISAAAADQIIVGGNVSLGGQLVANFAGSGYGHQTFTLLHADGGLSGTFANVVLTGLPAGLDAYVTYDANNVYLTTDHAPNISIGDDIVTEGGILHFGVTLEQAASQNIILSYDTFAGTASMADNDYLGGTGTLTILAGQTTGTINIQTVQDSKVEPDEIMSVHLLTASYGHITKGIGGGAILNDDGPVVPSISIGNASVTEGGVLQFGLTLSAAASQNITLGYDTFLGTASMADNDYLGGPGILTILAGQTTGTISIQTVQDSKVEPDETMSVHLMTVSFGTIALPIGIGTIVNDDVAPPNVSIGNASVTEGGVLQFGVTLNQATTQNITLGYDTFAGTASMADNDYSGGPGTLTILAGQTTGTISIQTVQDTKFEPDETMSVHLLTANFGNITQGVGTGTIVNDDPAPPNISIGNASVSEGGVLHFGVTLSAAASQNITLGYDTFAGIASMADNDYLGGPGTLTILAGQTTGTINIQTVQDSKFEPDETMSVHLLTANFGNITQAVGTGTIVNDDPAPPNVSIGNASVTEGGVLQFGVTLDRTATQNVVLGYDTFAGTASMADNDYLGGTGTLTILAGQTTGTINIQTVQDTKVEPDETMSVHLLSASLGNITQAVGTGTIVNEDVVPNIAIGNASVTEGGVLQFGVTLNQATTQNVILGYDTFAGTASMADNDYLGGTGTLTILAGQTTGTISIQTVQDSKVESDETMSVHLLSASLGNITQGIGTGTIVNDDVGQGFQMARPDLQARDFSFAASPGSSVTTFFGTRPNPLATTLAAIS